MKQAKNKPLQLPAGSEPVLAAVSGGPDSMVLLDLLLNSGRHIEAVYVHHHLRKEAEAEIEQIRQTAENAGCLFHVKHISPGKNQADYRRKRYAACYEVMKERRLPLLATAHHADDQAETMLMQLIRGVLFRPAGMSEKRPVPGGTLIRPLLFWTKGEIYTYARENSISFSRDASNDSSMYQRNRLRQRILPAVREENPSFSQNAVWMAERAQEEEAYLQKEAAALLPEVRQSGGGVLISCEEWEQIPAALRFRCLHLLLSRLDPDISWGREHLEAVLRLFGSGSTTGSVTLPGNWTAESRYSDVYIGKEEGEADPFCLPLDPEETVELPFGTVTAGMSACGEQSSFWEVPHSSLPLYVRSRRPGDRIVTLSGTRKIKKIFIDHKIPRKVRQEWPIVTDSHGTILEIPFLERALPYSVENTETTPLYLSYTRGSNF
ncbi:tRNA lysidine(34) synthetase TilS [Alkalicoccus urumqiensis]|uniref:tRNA(Ile)-lysidine synthase n=1 Tax=Alkalicoccus urumqiensis TaxID=1548213 RepID=A0A2P6MDQ4_ALKUR|nr:tRNA lysidine(34) synthetase TilS [Alkalicoccus urumqiensis]PRO64403.1 tRNA lysidine(34) synthetase TilS [Alkalicoccus urumqiensis]